MSRSNGITPPRKKTPDPALEAQKPEPVKETPKPAVTPSRTTTKKSRLSFTLTLESVNACETEEEIFDYLMNANKQQIIDFAPTFGIAVRGYILKICKTTRAIAKHVAHNIFMKRLYDERKATQSETPKPIQSPVNTTQLKTFVSKQQICFSFDEDGEPYTYPERKAA